MNQSVVYFTSDDIHEMNLLFETEDYVRAWDNVDDAFFSYSIGVSYKQRVTIRRKRCSEENSYEYLL